MTAPSGGGSRYAPWYVRAAAAGVVVMVVYIAGGGDLLAGSRNVGCHLFRSVCTVDVEHPELPQLTRATTPDYGPSYTGLRQP